MNKVQQTKMRHILRLLEPTIIILILIASTTLATFLVNNYQIQQITQNTIIVDPSTSFEDIKNKVEDNQVVQIEGTINPYFVLKFDDNIYYSSLKEYGFNYIVKFNKSKLNFTKQTFTGKILKFGSYSPDIVKKLNDPVNLQTANIDQFGQVVMDQVTSLTSGKFDGAILINDGELIDKNTIYFNISLFFIVALILLILVFRKQITKFNRSEKIADWKVGK